MPHYLYECHKCNETFEYDAKKYDDKPDSCGRCGSDDISRTFKGQTFGFSVKGPNGSKNHTIEKLTIDIKGAEIKTDPDLVSILGEGHYIGISESKEGNLTQRNEFLEGKIELKGVTFAKAEYPSTETLS